MKVSIQQDLPQDEFERRFGAISSAGIDEAHAALLRAQGIKPVSVETTYEAGARAAVTPVPQQTSDPSPLYGMFIQLADAVAELRARVEGVASPDVSALEERLSALATHMMNQERDIQAILSATIPIYESKKAG